MDREQLGAVAPPGDVGRLSMALEHVLERGREPYAAGLSAAAAAQTWSRVAEPLAQWISQPPPHARLGETPGAVRPTLGQRLREAAYLGGGRSLLARRSGLSTPARQAPAEAPNGLLSHPRRP